MKPMLKKLLFTAIFLICTLIIPLIVMFIFVDSDSGFIVYVMTFGIIIFSTLGYIVASVHQSSKEIHDAVEEMKLQNAAIAYKLTQVKNDDSAIITEPVKDVESTEVEPPKKVNLNPADPLDFN